MKIILNKFAIFILSLFILINFLAVPKSTFAYNTKNLTPLSIMVKD